MDDISFTKLKKNLKKDYSGLKTVKLAVMGDSATQLLVQALRGYGYLAGINLEIYEADYDQIERQVFDPQSGLYQFEADFLLIFQSTQKLLEKFNRLSAEQQNKFHTRQMDFIESIYSTLKDAGRARLIYCNFALLNYNLYGNYAQKTPLSFEYQQRSINFHLMDAAANNDNLFILDLDSIQAELGRSRFFDPKMYFTADMALSLDALPVFSRHCCDIINALNGRIKKCVILDLDNTLWGGVIGDDGIENIQIGGLGLGKAFSQFQTWLLALKNRGILLAVCSKNNENIAKDVFINHPDMALKLDDFVMFVANWENKVDNILHIQSTLNLGMDSFVFIDDNPFERNMVREGIADICVPELPEDPAEYLIYLQGLNLFEAATSSSNDTSRTWQYQQEAKRAQIKKRYANEAEYLSSLQMKAEVSEFVSFDVPRVAQLTQRSNQFNLRTQRYADDDIQKILESDSHIGLSVKLEDKYGAYGLISVVILEERDTEFFIDTWIMSCRVLKRTVEDYVLNSVLSFIAKKDNKPLVGEYIPTLKNELVREHYKNLGFNQQGNYWVMDPAHYESRKTYINN